MGRAVAFLTGGLAAASLSACDMSIGLGGLYKPHETRDAWVVIEGTVRAAEDGTPVAGATVEHFYVGDRFATTDAAGRSAGAAQGGINTGG